LEIVHVIPKIVDGATNSQSNIFVQAIIVPQKCIHYNLHLILIA